MNIRPPQTGLGPALAGLLLVVAMMAWLKEDLNPDWTGYALIYSDTGAWLADQNRDPLFLALVGVMRTLWGPDGYPEFRITVAAYFAVFTWFLLRGRVLPFDADVRHAWPLLLLGLLPFVSARFTIQIREGLGLTVVLMGMAMLSVSNGQALQRVWRTRQLLALVMFSLGTLIHSGIGLLLLAVIAGLLLGHMAMRSIGLELWILLALAIAGMATAVGISVFGLTSEAGNRLFENLYGDQAYADIKLSGWKWAYWGAYGLGVAAVAHRILSLYRMGRLPENLRQLLGMVALVMLPAIYVTALLLLANGFPPAVVSGASRMMNMLLSVTLLVLALRGALNFRLGLFAVLVLVDQARIILEAVLAIVAPEL